MKCDDLRPALGALVDGELSREEERALRGHLERCSACARELEERRGFSELLRRSFEDALDAAEPPAGSRERLAERMYSSSRLRLAIPARLAAALLFGIAVGLGAWAVGLSRPTRLQREVRDKIRDGERMQEEIRQITRGIVEDTDCARKAVPVRETQDSRTLVIQEGVSVIESKAVEPAAKALAQLVADTASPNSIERAAACAALKRLEPSRLEDLRKAATKAASSNPDFIARVVAGLEERAQPVERGKVVITNTVNGVTVSLTQLGDGRVKLVVPGRPIEAAGMAELLRRHADLCRQYGVSGRDGSVMIGDASAALDLHGQLELLFRTGTWSDDVQWDAYRASISSLTPDSKKIEARVKEMQERCRRAAQEASLPEVRVDADRILKDVQTMSSRQLEEARSHWEKELPKLDARLKALRELRWQARGLRVFAEASTRER